MLNPILFAEVQQEAEAKDKGDGHIGKAFRRAVRSIQVCPVTYHSINELLQLQYVGKVMVAKLEKKQKEYYAARGMGVPVNVGAVPDPDAAAQLAEEMQEAAKIKRGANGAGKKRAGRGSARKEPDDSDDDGLGENSAFAVRLQAGGGSESRHCVCPW